MIAILPWVDRVICSSIVDILSFLLAAGGKEILPYAHRINTDKKSIKNKIAIIHNQRKNELTSS